MMKERKNLHNAILVFHTNLHAAITATHISFDNSRIKHLNESGLNNRVSLYKATYFVCYSNFMAFR